VPKTILWDLETFGFDFKADKGFILCGSYKELGKSEVVTVTRSNLGSDMWNDKEVCKELWRVLSKAERWITHNGKRFDVRFLNVRLLKHGLPLLPPMGKRHFDTCETTWKNLAMRASLKNIQEFFELKNKKTPVDLQTWTKAAAGNATALAKVVEHCESDVKMLEEYSKKILPIVSETDNPVFHNCHPKFLRNNGLRICDKKTYKRLFCVKCSGWFRGEIKK
jgi:uncharacterized protein YprB with RNaseH-like and TPR domain